jgi:hypothetical protein
MSKFKVRFREEKKLFRKSLLVLEIGVARKKGSYCSFNGDTLAPPWWDEDEIVYDWRDAVPADLMNMEVTYD